MSSYLSMPDGQKVPVRDGLVIGRVAGCDIVIDDTKASRRHARICVEGGVVEIEDLGSSNGTTLNGKPVQRRLLRDGDEVQIGATKMIFRNGVATVSAAAAPADDVDLFGDEAPSAPPAATPPPSPPPSPPPAPRAEPVRKAPPPPPAPPRAPTPPPRADTVEFADEVVEVKARAQDRGKPAASAPADPTRVEQKQRVLQFNKVDDRGGGLGDDLAQMSSGTRLLVYGAVLAVAIGIAWGLMTLVS